MQKPSLPKGTRDFGPVQMARRTYILDTIKETFQLFGYQQIETPAMENLNTLTGKYGDEGDQLLFKILDSGEYYEKLKSQVYKSIEVYNADYSSSLIRFYSSIVNRYLAEDAKAVRVDSLRNELTKFSDFILVKERASNPIHDFSRIKELAEIQEKNSKKIARELKQEIQFLKLQKSASDEVDTFYIESKINQIVTQLLNGIILHDLASQDLFEKKSKELTSIISEKGLRYDLTVPFARYVVMNRNDLTFPFKRYQIQPVWRADRPQKGRYREFYQCDADVVGTDSLVCEAEIILMIRRVFEKLSLKEYSIKINNRKILTGIAEAIGEAGKEGPLCVAIDKLDKIGWEKVKEELTQRGFGANSIENLAPLVSLESDLTGKLDFLKSFLKSSETGLKGVEELEQVFDILEKMGVDLDHVDFDIMLARGLSYYTGAIFEVKVHHVSIGSVSGGGRYDNLTGVFGLPGVSGVGFSFGVDRLYDVLDELGIFPTESHTSTRLLLTYVDQAGFGYALSLLNQFRNAGVKTEIYPNQVKIQKQFDFANKKGIPFVGVCGDEEMKTGVISVKNMVSGEQVKMTVPEAVAKVG